MRGWQHWCWLAIIWGIYSSLRCCILGICWHHHASSCKINASQYSFVNQGARGETISCSYPVSTHYDKDTPIYSYLQSNCKLSWFSLLNQYYNIEPYKKEIAKFVNILPPLTSSFLPPPTLPTQTHNEQHWTLKRRWVCKYPSQLIKLNLSFPSPSPPPHHHPYTMTTSYLCR